MKAIINTPSGSLSSVRIHEIFHEDELFDKLKEYRSDQSTFMSKVQVIDVDEYLITKDFIINRKDIDGKVTAVTFDDNLDKPYCCAIMDKSHRTLMGEGLGEYYYYDQVAYYVDNLSITFATKEEAVEAFKRLGVTPNQVTDE